MPGVELKNIPINDQLHDMELMLIDQLCMISHELATRHGVLGVRANYGTGTLPTAFHGVEIFEAPRDLNTLPINRPLPNDDAVRKLLDYGIPDFKQGFAAQALEFGEMTAEIFKDYPKIREYVKIYHPDTQGPLDILDMLWGADLFFQFYDEPELVHDLMQLITDTYTAFLDKWFAIVPKRNFSVHWWWMHPGNLFLRCDSAMNIPSAMFEEFELPYLNQVLEHFDGGVIHLCGRGDHWIPSAAKNLPKMYGFQFSQPQLNDVRILLDAAHQYNQKILGFTAAASDVYEQNPNAHRGVIHVEHRWGQAEGYTPSDSAVYSYLKDF